MPAIYALESPPDHESCMRRPSACLGLNSRWVTQRKSASPPRQLVSAHRCSPVIPAAPSMDVGRRNPHAGQSRSGRSSTAAPPRHLRWHRVLCSLGRHAPVGIEHRKRAHHHPPGKGICVCSTRALSRQRLITRFETIGSKPARLEPSSSVAQFALNEGDIGLGNQAPRVLSST